MCVAQPLLVFGGELGDNLGVPLVVGRNLSDSERRIGLGESWGSRVAGSPANGFLLLNGVVGFDEAIILSVDSQRRCCRRHSEVQSGAKCFIIIGTLCEREEDQDYGKRRKWRREILIYNVVVVFVIRFLDQGDHPPLREWVLYNASIYNKAANLI